MQYKIRWLPLITSVQKHFESQQIMSDIILNIRRIHGEITVITAYFNQQTLPCLKPVLLAYAWPDQRWYGQ